MKPGSILKLAAACSLTLALSAVTFGQNQNVSKDQNNQAGNQPTINNSAGRVPYNEHVVGTTRDEERQSKKAADTFKEFMKSPDKGIPRSVFDSAECVAAFPGVYRGGSIAGERGVISCRTGNGWSAPVYVNLRGGAPGSQAGSEPADLVIMFMNKDVVSSLPNEEFKVGADTQAAAGPVGPGAAANAPVLCYSRSRGVVSGVVVDAAAIEIDRNDMRDVYGDAFDPAEIMGGAKVKATSKVMAFTETLSRHTSRQARK